MATPAAFHPIPQRTLTDCVIASMAMILNLDYLTVAAAASKCVKGWEKSGLTTREAMRVGRALKARFTSLPASGEEDLPTGILWLRRGNTYHAVVHFNGVVYDPSDGVVWEPTTYLKATRYKPHRLLVP